MKLLKYIYMKMKTKKIGKIRIPYDLYIEFFNDNAKFIKEHLGGIPQSDDNSIGEIDHPKVDKNNPHVERKLCRFPFLKDI